jgi:hypothetical protein
MSMQSRPSLGGGGEWIFNAIKRNPEGLLLLAAGVVLMMRTNSPQTSQAPATGFTSSRTMDESSKSAAQVGDTLRVDPSSSYASMASDTARQTMDAAKSYASSAGEYADQAKRMVGEQSDRVLRQTQSMAQGVLQNQPLAIVAAGLAAGVALAAAFPSTELEKETLGPVGDRVSKAAEHFGDQIKQATSKAGEKLKSAAEERGLHTEGLKEVAGEVVDVFKESMTDRAEQTNDRAPARPPDSVDRSP